MICQARAGVKAMLHSVYEQPDAPAVIAQFDRLLDYVDGKLAQFEISLRKLQEALIAPNSAAIWRM